MKSEFQYLVKGVLYLLLFLVLGFTLYGLFSHEKARPLTPPKNVISYDDLMNRPDIAEGKVLFDEKCSACHSITRRHEFFFDKIVDNNYDKAVLYAFIRNSDSVIKSGNVYYNKLFEEYNKTRMTSFPELTDKEIDEILSYIKVEKTFQKLPKND